jgi:hypothetical protein
MKLNKDLIMQENTVVWARTEEEAKILCEWADGEVLTSNIDDSYRGSPFFEKYKNQTCYNFYKGTFSELSFFVDEEYTILTLDDITIKEKEMEEMLVADFSGARVGDKTTCTVYGDGIIISINNKKINVSKDSYRTDRQDFIISYNPKGELLTYDETNGSKPSLFYHFEGQFPTIEACKRPLPKIEEDEKVLVWDGVEQKWNREYFSHFHSSGKLMICWGWGKTSYTGDETDRDIPREYWKTADGKHDSGNLEEIEG